MTDEIAIVGGGAWGTALAMTACRARRGALVWAHEAETVEAINARHMNPVFLPGMTLDPAIRATSDLGEIGGHKIVLLVMPSAHFREVARALAPHVGAGAIACVCTKGIELDSGALMTGVADDELPEARVAALSGPSFAADVARDLPTAVTVAGRGDAPAILSAALSSPNFRVYQSDDLDGIEIGGAVKNVIAIACGIAMGRGLGDNARAALISRGLAEMVRLGVALGGRPETLMGLSGLGDLVLTATSEQSRNFSTGLALGQDKSFAEIMAGRKSVVEGAVAAPAVLALARRHGVEMPICAAVDDVLAGRLTVDGAASRLMMRPAGPEFDLAFSEAT